MFTILLSHFDQVFPALFDWVSYPITVLTKKLYDIQMKIVDMDRLPCFFHLELLASLERLLCFCHTGSTAVFATSLMHRLGLSLGAITDGFPMLHQIFEQPSILSAMNHNFHVDARLWPLYNGYPAIASKAAQIFAYSLSHFMVSLSPFQSMFLCVVRRAPVLRTWVMIYVRSTKDRRGLHGWNAVYPWSTMASNGVRF